MESSADLGQHESLHDNMDDGASTKDIRDSVDNNDGMQQNFFHSGCWDYMQVASFSRVDSDDESEDECCGTSDAINDGRDATRNINRLKSSLKSQNKTDRLAVLCNLDRDINLLRLELHGHDVPPLNNPPPYDTESIVLTHKSNGAQVSDLAKGEHVSDWKKWEKTFVPLIQQFPDKKSKATDGSFSNSINSVARNKLQFILNTCGCALFLLFSDPSERCRSLAIKCVQQLSLAGLDMGKHIAFLMPAIFSRYPEILYDAEEKVFVHDPEQHEFYKRGGASNRQDREQIIDGKSRSFVSREPSEEIRFELCEFISCLIRSFVHYGSLSLLDVYFSDIILALQSHLSDPFPNIKIAAAKLLVQILRLPQWEIGAKYYASAIGRASLPLLRHRNSRVRLESISLLEASICVPDREKVKGAGSEVIVELIGFREENVIPVSVFYKHECGININILAELVTDKNKNVRFRCCEMISYLMCCLPDRYNYQQRLLPYLLSFYNDDDPRVQRQAMAAVDNCGQQYEVENPDEIVERRQYGVDGDERCNHIDSLPQPFEQRPRIGSRFFVRNNTKRFFKALLSELRNWMPKTRLQSAKLLHILVIYCEEHLTMDINNTLFEVVKALQSCMSENDKDSDNLQQILEVILKSVGRYVDPCTYVRFLLPRMNNDVSTGTTFSEGGIHSDLSCIVNTKALGCLIQGSLPCRVLLQYVTILKSLSSQTSIGQLAGHRRRLESLKTLTLLFQSINGSSISGASTLIFEESGKLWNTLDVTQSLTKSLEDLLNQFEDKPTIDAIHQLQHYVTSALQNEQCIKSFSNLAM